MEHSSLHSPHHSVVQIARLVQEGRAAADPHLNGCPLCAETAKLLTAIPFRSTEPPSGAPVCHLDSDSLSDLILEPNPAGAEQSLVHAAGCETCAAKLAELIDIFSDDPLGATPMLRTSTSTWRRDMARQIVASRPGKRPTPWAKYGAVAASVLFAGVFGYRTLVKSEPADLLAEAYTQSRPFDYRLPDKGYARVTQRMSQGGTFDKPPALIRAQAEISTKLSDALITRGRAELLSGDIEAAIATLERARETQPGVEGVALDLACAYAARGDGAHPEDYAKALDLLERLLRTKPDDKAALFNRALVLERMQRFDDAGESWSRYLKADPSGAWADEARQRQESASQKKSTVKRP